MAERKPKKRPAPSSLKVKKAPRSPALDFPIAKVMRRLRIEVKRWPTPAITIMAEQKDSPYKILVSTILSLRTQDKTTAEGSARLYELAQTPAEMIRLTPARIAKAIYPVGFYKTKAKTIAEISRILLDEYDGSVPDSVEELVKLKGVGRKTANLVVTMGYGNMGICVDTHVHRIANRWGYISTKNPDATEMLLRELLPRRYWIPINDLLVTFGQNLCKPTSPVCSECKIAPHCARVGVSVSR